MVTTCHKGTPIQKRVVDRGANRVKFQPNLLPSSGHFSVAFGATVAGWRGQAPPATAAARAWHQGECHCDSQTA
jgi:hypothetical protein